MRKKTIEPAFLLDRIMNGKGKPKMKKSVDKLKKLFFVCIFVLLVLIGCSQAKQRSGEDPSTKSLTAEEEPLVIFYTDGSGVIVQNFLKGYPKLNVEMHMVGSSMQAVENLIEKEGEPDLLLLALGGNPEETVTIQEQYAADITELYENDFDLRESDYFPGTFDVFREDKRLIGIPLGISLPSMTVREENWIGSALEALEDDYSTIELLNAIEKEIDRAAQEQVLFSGDMGGPFYDELNRMGAIQKTEEGVIIDEKIFERVYTVHMKRHKLENEVSEYLKKVETDEPKHILSGLDPSNYAGEFLVSEWYGGAPQVYLPYAASVNMNFFEQETHTVYYPAGDTTDALGARVEVVGVVGTNSRRQQEAYDILRMMMDMEIQYFVQPGGHITNYGDSLCPVNKERAYAMIDDFEQYAEDYYDQSNKEDGIPDTVSICDGTGQLIYLIEKVTLGDEKENLQEALERISFLYRNGDKELKSNEIAGRYFADEVEDYTGCYAEFVQLYNSDMSEEETAQVVEEEIRYTDSWLRYMQWSGLEVTDENELKQIGELEEKSSIEPVTDEMDLSEEYDTEKIEVLQEQLRNTEVGATVSLGSFEQDDDPDNGTEVINWIVLEKDDEKALLISEISLECMDVMPQNSMGEMVSDTENFSWEESLLRSWLNNEFIGSALGTEEAALILNTQVSTVASYKLEETNDKVFVLNPTEAALYLDTPEKRMAQASQYAMNRKQLSDSSGDNKPWVMRQVALKDLNEASSKYVIQMSAAGEVDAVGERTTWQSYVRPAMWVYIAE